MSTTDCSAVQLPAKNDKSSGSIADGLKRRMPAEWSRHEACLILYPHWASTFRLEKARPQVEQVAKAIATVGNEKVILYCKTSEDRDVLLKRLSENHDDGAINGIDKSSPNIQVELCPSNDTWARDTGPTFVYCEASETNEDDLALVGLDWDFNAYGGVDDGLYWPCDLDRQVASVICRQLSIPRRSVPIVLEGGGIHTDGEGTILTTEECLLNPNRNPNLSKEQVEQIVLPELGGSKMIWLPDGLAFDSDTNGHIDNWACFVRPGHVILAWTDDETNDSINFERCRKAMQKLENTQDAKGRNLTVHKLYLPSPLFYTEDEVNALAQIEENEGDQNVKKAPPRTIGERMAASYINFYIANEAVVVPQFNDAIYDEKAIQTLTPLFAPERKVVGVSSREILVGGGNIHCITQQLPTAT